MKKIQDGMQVFLSPPLQEYIAKGDEEVQKLFEYELGQVREFMGMSKKISGKERAKVVNHLGDEILRLTIKNSPQVAEISCKKGCSACCYQEVIVTHDEAHLLISESKDLNWAEVEMQSGVPHKELPYMTRKCVFLKNDECSVYENRPVACRKYMVTSPAEKCDSRKYPGGDVEVMFSLKAELFSSAFMTMLDSGPMAKMLLIVKEKLKL